MAFESPSELGSGGYRIPPHHRGAKSRRTHWGLWTASLSGVAGVVALLTLSSGIGGATPDVPTALQVGSQASTTSTPTSGARRPHDHRTHDVGARGEHDSQYPSTHDRRPHDHRTAHDRRPHDVSAEDQHDSQHRSAHVARHHCDTQVQGDRGYWRE